MKNFEPVPEGKDPQLWQQASERTNFKRHFTTYLIMNAFFWVLWFFTTRMDGEFNLENAWPIWPMIGWGIGIAFHYARVYVHPKYNLVNKEYEKLNNQNNK